MAAVNIFTYLNQLYYKTNTNKYDPKIASIFNISLWLSHDSRLIGMVNKINELIFTLPPQAVYDYYYHLIPKGKRYIKWVKKDKEDIKKDKILKELMTEVDISKREAMLYKNLV